MFLRNYIYINTLYTINSVVKFPPPLWLNTIIRWSWFEQTLKNASWGNFQTSFSFSGHTFFYEDVYTIWFLIIPNYFYLKSLVFILQTWISFAYWCILRSLVEICSVERKRIGALLIVFQLLKWFSFYCIINIFSTETLSMQMYRSWIVSCDLYIILFTLINFISCIAICVIDFKR